MENLFKNKKVLLVGLGRLGGGVASAKFLIANGARLTVTDMGSEKDLKNSLSKLKRLNIKYILGGHRESDFKNNDIIVFNQAVSFFSKWVKLARKYKKPFFNETTLFLNLIQKENPKIGCIAVTGTRGKTTTAAWINYFLKSAIIGGNIPTAGFLKIIGKAIAVADKTPLVLEMSSFQLEYMTGGLKAPRVAVITNLHVDHLNRHSTMENYAKAKSNIFLNQTKNDFLILNFDDKNKKLFLEPPAGGKPKGKIFFISLKPLPKKINGLFFNENKIYFQSFDSTRDKCKKEFVIEVKGFSPHQKYNLLSSLLAAHLFGKNWRDLIKKISTLPEIPFRQQIVFDNGNLRIVNDSTATSPEGVIAALQRFGDDNPVLIAGGTDKDLDFKNLAKEIKKKVSEKNLYLLNGSATKKLIIELNNLKYFKKQPKLFENLRDVLNSAKIKKGIILLSPGAASFEKFKNEFDRGRKFNKLVKEIFK